MADDPAITDPKEGPQNNESEQHSNPPDEDLKDIQNTAVQDFIKGLGVETADDLKSIVEAKNESDKANQSELENVQADLKKANSSKEELEGQISKLAAENSALKSGINKDHVNDAVILAQAYVSDGSAKTVDEALEKVVKANPTWAGKVQTGSDGAAVAGNVSNNATNKHKGFAQSLKDLNKFRITK